jgi:hypothetical protein
MKPTRCTNFSNLYLERDSTCFGHFLCPVWLIQLLCVQWRTPDDRQRNCPKHVDFLSKNKFEKLVHLLCFIIRNLTQCTVTWMLYCVCIKCFYTLPAIRLLLISRWDLCSFVILLNFFFFFFFDNEVIIVIPYWCLGTTYWSHLQVSRNSRRRSFILGPVFKAQEIQEEGFLDPWTNRLSRNKGQELPLYAVW